MEGKLSTFNTTWTHESINHTCQLSRFWRETYTLSPLKILCSQSKTKECHARTEIWSDLNYLEEMCQDSRNGRIKKSSIEIQQGTIKQTLSLILCTKIQLFIIWNTVVKWYPHSPQWLYHFYQLICVISFLNQSAFSIFARFSMVRARCFESFVVFDPSKKF